MTGAYGVAVEKETNFRGAVEEFANVYHYHLESPSGSAYQDLANLVVAKDRLVYSPGFTYKTVRVFGPTDGPASANLIRFVGDLTGTGSKTVSGPTAYGELTYVVSMRAGRSETTQRRIYVRKFIRIGSTYSTSDSPTTGAVSTTTRTFLEDWMESLRRLGAGLDIEMCTPRDQIIDVDAEATALSFMRIRQMHQ
jgi:hypothetical protein